MLASTDQVGVLSYRSDVASRLGVARGTLHNYIEALRFIESLQDTAPDMAAALETFSAAAVAVYERWWRRDAEAVRKHIEQAAKLGWSARKVIADEAKARSAVRPRSMLESALDRRNDKQDLGTSAVIGEAFRRAGARAPDVKRLIVEDNGSVLSSALGAAQLLVDREIEAQKLPSLEIAVFEAGVGETGRAHIRNARNLLARATVAASAHTLSLILVEDVLAVSEFGKALPAFEGFQIDGSSSSLMGFELLAGAVVIIANADEFVQTWTGRGETMWQQV